MTLYWGYRENKTCIQNFLPSNSLGKVEDVVQISKPHKDNKNNNTYALVGDTLDVYCLGMVKEQTTKYKGKLFLGQKVYATSKEELCIYYREAVKRYRSVIDDAIKRAEHYQYNWAQNEVERLKQIIRESESQYKHLIERIKTL